MKKINESFMCIGCGREISSAKKTCRNHCPFCFTSLHVDDKIPGDRASNCKGLMQPTQYFLKHGERKILFECSKCGKKHWNKCAEDDHITQLLTIIQPK